MIHVLSNKKSHNFLVCMAYSFIYVLFIFDVIINLRSRYMWEDESFTFYMIHHTFFNIINLTSHDVHPFLYYFIAKVMDFPFNNFYVQIKILRLTSALPYFILLLIGNISIRRKFSNKTSLIFMLAIVTMPNLINNIYQIRMYGWAMLFTTLFFIQIMYVCIGAKKNSYLSFFLASGYALLASYTHYFALIAIAILYILILLLFLLLKKKIRYILSSILIDIVLYLPWIHIIFEQTKKASKGFWGVPHNIYFLISIIDNLFISNTNSRSYQLLLHVKIFALILILVFCIMIYLIKRSGLFNKYSLIYMVGILLPILVIIFGEMISEIIKQNVLITRYITPAMGIFWLSISIILGISLSNVNINAIIKVVLILLFIFVGFKSYQFNVLTTLNNTHQFNITLHQFNKIPNNAHIIYDYPPIAYCASSYLSHNYVLGKSYDKKNNDIWYKVYPNMKIINDLRINNSKPTYFIKLDGPSKNIITGSSKLTSKFIKRNHNNMIKLCNINFPFDGGQCILYKIKRVN